MTIIEKLTALVGWEVDNTELDEFNQQAESVIDWGKKLAGAVAFVSTAFAALGTVVTKETVRNIKLAESVGLSTDSYLAWEGVMKHVGFEGEKVIDLVEEMTNKFGEMKGLGDMTSARESLQQLNLKFADLRDLAPEKQFMAILDAAKNMEDAQVAASAVDMLMGGEANRIVGLLRSYEGSVEDVLKTHRDLNMLTDQGIAGAVAWGNAFDNISTVATSLFAELSGRAGAIIVPYVNAILDWVAANRELVKQKISWVVRGIADAFRWLAWAGARLADTVKALGGFTNTLKILASIFAAWKAFALADAIGSLGGALKIASGGADLLGSALEAIGRIGFVALLVAAGLALQDLYVYLTGGKSQIDEWTRAVLPKAEKAVMSFLGVTRELSSAELDAYRQRMKLASSVDAQKFFDMMETAKFRQRFLSVFESIRGAYSSFISYISRRIFAPILDPLRELELSVTSIPENLLAIGEALLNALVTPYRVGIDIVKQLFAALWHELPTELRQALESVLQPFSDFKDWLTALDIPGVIVNGMRAALEWIRGFIPFLKDEWAKLDKAVSQFIDSIWSKLKSVVPFAEKLFSGTALNLNANLVSSMQPAVATPSSVSNTSSSQTTSQTNNINVSVNMRGSTSSPRAIAAEVKREISGQMQRAAANLSSGRTR